MEKRELRLPKKIVAKHLVASTQAHHYPPRHPPSLYHLSCLIPGTGGQLRGEPRSSGSLRCWLQLLFELMLAW